MTDTKDTTDGWLSRPLAPPTREPAPIEEVLGGKRNG